MHKQPLLGHLEAKKTSGRPTQDGGELVKAYDAIPIGVGLVHHVGELAVRQGVAHLRHGPRELGGGDVAVAVPVEGPEHLEQLLLVYENLLVIHVGEDGVGELVKLDVAVAVLVHVGEEGVELVPGGLDAERPEEGGELQVGQAAVGVHVEVVEDLSQLLHLVHLELGHGGHGRRGRRLKLI